MNLINVIDKLKWNFKAKFYHVMLCNDFLYWLNTCLFFDTFITLTVSLQDHVHQCIVYSCLFYQTNSVKSEIFSYVCFVRQMNWE